MPSVFKRSLSKARTQCMINEGIIGWIDGQKSFSRGRCLPGVRGVAVRGTQGIGAFLVHNLCKRIPQSKYIKRKDIEMLCML